jgi:hypothetical protein
LLSNKGILLSEEQQQQDGISRFIVPAYSTESGNVHTISMEVIQGSMTAVE